MNIQAASRSASSTSVVSVLADAVVQLAIITQILHNEAEAYDDLLQKVFFHAIDRYDVSCHSSSGFNESDTGECEAFRDDLRSLLHQHLARLPSHQQR